MDMPAAGRPEGRALLILNLVIMLFPPIPLFFARGSMSMALFYFMGSGIFLVASVLWLQHRSGARGE